MTSSKVRAAMGATSLAAAAVLTACGSSSSPSTSASSAAGTSGAAGAASGSAGSSGSSSAGAGSGSPADFLQKAYAGTLGKPPTTAPAHKSGVSIWLVSCGQISVSCSNPVASATEAAKALGWTVNVCDGQLNPTGWASCIRQATAAKPTAILPVGLDCPLIQQPLVEANKAGTKTIAAGGLDCADLGGPKVFSGTLPYLAGVSGSDWWRGLGALRADYLIGKTNGKAKVLELNFSDAVWGPMQTEGFDKELAKCSGCSVVKKLDVGNQDVVSGTLRTKFSTALLQNPTTNGVSVPLDAWFPLGLSQAVTSSGRASALTVVGTFGEAPNIDLMKNHGGETASSAFSAAQSGWGAIDTTIRVLAGQAPVAQGIGYQVIDKTHNLPASGQSYTYPGLDFKAAYKKAWGV